MDNFTLAGYPASGVDGTKVGRSDRTDYWGENIDSGLAARTAGFVILQFWDPKYAAIDNIVDHGVKVGKKIAALIQELKNGGLIP